MILCFLSFQPLRAMSGRARDAYKTASARGRGSRSGLLEANLVDSSRRPSRKTQRGPELAAMMLKAAIIAAVASSPSGAHEEGTAAAPTKRARRGGLAEVWNLPIVGCVAAGARVDGSVTFAQCAGAALHNHLVLPQHRYAQARSRRVLRPQ